MRSWATLAARSGAGRHRPLVVLVVAVQVLAVALGSALPALLGAAELQGVRRTLADAPGTGVTVIADRPGGSVSDTAASARRAVDRLFRDAARTTSAVSDVSVTGSATGPSGTVQPFLGELPASGTIRVTAGRWPARAPAGRVAVAVPEAGAAAIGAAVGVDLPLRVGWVRVTGRVVALYRALDPQGATWTFDPLSGRGSDPDHVDPENPYAPPVALVGPLLVPPGTLDEARIPPRRVDVAFTPDFGAASVGAVEALGARLPSVGVDVPVDTGRIAETVTAETALGPVVSGAIAQLWIARTTAAVAGLLLVVLAVVVLVQAAVLLDAAREDERFLLTARGASRRQLVLLAASGAVATAAVAVVLGVPLGAGLASAIRGQAVGLPGVSWAAGTAIALIAVVVRVLPRLRTVEPAAVRSRRGTGLMRGGADLVLLAVAALLGWQLVVRRVDTTAGIDPVLVAAPAVLVLAGALVALRVVPLVGRAGETVARRSRGVATALAGWELSRRSPRATATVLLVTLSISTGAFGAVTEATRIRSQLDQSQLAVGAPVRVPADPSRLPVQSALLSSGARGTPQPAIRRSVSVAQDTGTPIDPALGDGSSNAVVLGLTARARAMLERGRLRTEGGATIGALRSSAPVASGAELPAGATALTAVVRVGDARHRIAGAAAALRAVLEGPDGLLTTVDLGAASVDGQQHPLRGRVPAAGMRLVGVQLQVVAADPIRYLGNAAAILPLRVLRLEAGGRALTPPDDWRSVGGPLDGDLGRGLAVPVAADLRQNPVSRALVGWTPVTSLRGVWTRQLVRAIRATRGQRFALSFGDVLIPCEVGAVAATVPGSGEDPGGAPEPDAVVVDQRSLSLLLVQNGDPLQQADQWWVDVAPGAASAYLAAHAHAAGGAGAVSAVVLAERLTDGPLRIASAQALLLLLGAAVALGLLGFGVDVAASLGARRREMAQLRAIGLRRGVLERMLAAESTLRVLLGAVLGLALGVLLGGLAAPRLVVGPDGGRPVPVPDVVLPGPQLLVLVIGAVLASLLAVVLIVRSFRGLDPARILREGDG